MVSICYYLSFTDTVLGAVGVLTVLNAGRKRRLTRSNLIAHPAQPVNKEKNTHRGRSDTTLYSRRQDVTSAIHSNVLFSPEA